MTKYEKIVIGLMGLFLIFIVIVATDFVFLWLPLDHSSEYPQKVSALFMAGTVLVMLFVVYATFHATNQSRVNEQRHRRNELEKEDRERSERQLNEMIKWAEDIKIASFTPDVLDESSVAEGKTLKAYGMSLSRSVSIDAIVRARFPELLADLKNVVETVVGLICIYIYMSAPTLPPISGFSQAIIDNIKKQIEEKGIDVLFTEYTFNLTDFLDELLRKANDTKSQLVAKQLSQEKSSANKT